jgi:hypothetical protein
MPNHSIRGIYEARATVDASSNEVVVPAIRQRLIESANSIEQVSGDEEIASERPTLARRRLLINVKIKVEQRPDLGFGWSDRQDGAADNVSPLQRRESSLEPTRLRSTVGVAEGEHRRSAQPCCSVTGGIGVCRGTPRDPHPPAACIRKAFRGTVRRSVVPDDHLKAFSGDRLIRESVDELLQHHTGIPRWDDDRRAWSFGIAPLAGLDERTP